MAECVEDIFKVSFDNTKFVYLNLLPWLSNSIFTLSRTLKDKVKSIMFDSKASTANIESLFRDIKSMTLPHASMSVPRRSITISHSSMTLPHSSMTHGQASISFPHSSIILSHKSITFPHSPISLPHKSMALPHSPKYGCFKRMRTCFTLISRKTGAIFSLSFFRQYKVCFIWQNEKTKQQITEVLQIWLVTEQTRLLHFLLAFVSADCYEQTK